MELKTAYQAEHDLLHAAKKLADELGEQEKLQYFNLDIPELIFNSRLGVCFINKFYFYLDAITTKINSTLFISIRSFGELFCISYFKISWFLIL